MPQVAPISISAQVALQNRLDAVANNIANTSTPGFRAGGVRFEALLSDNLGGQTDYVSSANTFISRNAGGLTPTGGALDVAVNGDAWFAVKTPAGTAYTRDGRFHVDVEGNLKTVDNYPVLDPGAGEITIDAAAGPVTIGDDGSISQQGKRIANLGLFTIPDKAKLTRYDNSAVFTDLPAEPVEDATSNSIRQGFIEGSNVNPILELTRLIAVQRAFDRANASVDQNDELQQQAIRTLSPTS
ncbi:MAG: flagellar basal-body rod protein FlgF [Rhizobiales bacterium]|nr:flagellar basal-body rod protein FlgF [Hyphomicrobiales bacterium]MBN9008767.1 flagellar basal-body rod protein FlgF [Hyphomicrobiales bacterium]